jgi:replicative DNA helicase
LDDAERSVIGSVLLRNDVYARVHLEPQDFFDPRLRLLWGAIQGLAREHRPIDTLLLENRLNGHGSPALFSALSECVAAVPTADNVEHYANIVAADSLARRTRLALSDLARTDLPAEELLAKATATLQSLKPQRQQDAPRLRADEHARVLWQQPLPPAEPTGLVPLDEIIGGLRSESVAVLSGGTGRGKTGLALQTARPIARVRPVAYFTSELSERQVLARAAAQAMRRPWKQLYDMGSSGVDIVAGALEELYLWVVELRRGMNLLDELARIADAVGEAPVLVLDYLQSAARRLAEDFRLGTSMLSDQVGAWTRETRSTALVLSSVARAMYGGDEGKTTGQLVGASKDSGDVDFDGGVLMFLHTEDMPEGETTVRARLHVTKNRFGTTGVVGLAFNGPIGMFTPDARAKFHKDHLAVMDAVRVGAKTADEVRKALEWNQNKTVKIIKELVQWSVLDRCPLRLLEPSFDGESP